MLNWTPWPFNASPNRDLYNGITGSFLSSLSEARGVTDPSLSSSPKAYRSLPTPTPPPVMSRLCVNKLGDHLVPTSLAVPFLPNRVWNTAGE